MTGWWGRPVPGRTVTVCRHLAMSLPAGMARNAFAPPCTGDDTAAAPDPAEQVQPVSPDSKPGLARMFAAAAGEEWSGVR